MIYFHFLTFKRSPSPYLSTSRVQELPQPVGSAQEKQRVQRGEHLLDLQRADHVRQQLLVHLFNVGRDAALEGKLAGEGGGD